MGTILMRVDMEDHDMKIISEASDRLESLLKSGIPEKISVPADSNEATEKLAVAVNKMIDLFSRMSGSAAGDPEVQPDGGAPLPKPEKTGRMYRDPFVDNILESIQDGISVLDKNLTIRRVNGVMNRWYADNIPLEGKKCYECYQAKKKPCDFCPTLRCFQSARTERAVVPGLPDSPVEWIELFSFPITEPGSGKVTGAVELVRDITDRVHFEARLQEKQKMQAISTLAGGIAHEFNNALTGIIGNIELLRMYCSEDDKIDNYMESMKGSVWRIKRITDQLLAYSGGGKYHATVMSLNTFIEDSLPVIQKFIDPEIRVETDLAGQLLKIKADSTQMKMVLQAVLTNASEAIEGTGRIRVTTDSLEIDENSFSSYHQKLKPGRYARLTVHDDGKGMDAQTRKKIFEPFFTTKFQGRGLGMAAAYGIVLNHDGLITVDSEPGEGTAVHIYLPVITIETKEQGKPQPGIFQGTGTILAVEDEQIVMDVTRAMLKNLGYDVLEATTGKEAVRIAENFDGDIHLVLLDIKLPDMKGIDTFTAIKKLRPDTKVIVCSGYAIDGPVMEILEKGAQDFVQKPYSFETLSTKVKKVLERK